MRQAALEKLMKRVEAVAQRLDSKAKDLELRATVDVHCKNGTTAFLKSEAYLLRDVLKELKDG